MGEGSKVFDAFGGAALQAFSQQRSIDTCLVSFDDRVALELLRELIRAHTISIAGHSVSRREVPTREPAVI
ncbi:MAG TPA: hypothetical protein VL262_17345, partial [Vicinamibacterales bacterium]|nr:hypothetical protein [Vicinamibacterales bacterium]